MAPLKKVILIFALFFVALFISLPPEFKVLNKNLTRPNLDIKIGSLEIKRNFNLVLGLDLAGGSQLVYEADTSKISSDKKTASLESLRNVIDKRVNLFGVSEPNVQLSNFEGHDRVVVELPGVSDTKQAEDIIGKTAQLVFSEVEGASASATLKQTNLTGADLAGSSVVFDQTSGKPAVSLTFTKDGGDKFAKITGESVGQRVAIVLDGEVVSAPVVSAKITGGNAQITGNFTLDQAKQLSIELNAGALPVPVSLVQENTIGATLGAESINKSITAGVVGLFMVLLFMILSYGKLGLVADFGLLVFGVLTISIYKLIPVTLTLPGIAGFLLSVGMAVDSNILIFERFKEEKLKRNFHDALEVSFGRAWNSIRDAYVATLITCFVLTNPFDWNFLNTSGPVRGFAITLALGIGLSLFTGIVVSRNLLRVFIKEKNND